MKTIVIFALCCLGGFARDIQPYGPLMCRQLAKTSERNTTYHVHDLLCSLTDKGIEKKEDGIICENFESRCSTNTQCDYEKGFCLDGRCSCVVGYSFNFTLCQCVQRCFIYGDMFAKYHDYAIARCNQDTYDLPDRDESVDVCMNACRNSTVLTCVTAEIKHTSCNLCDKSLDQLQAGQLEDKRLAKGWVLFFRHCKRRA